MTILVACEFTGTVRDALLQRGHDAISCDLLPTESPGPHIQGDVREILGRPWDMVIAFPPCDHLAVSGARWFEEKIADGRQQKGIDFFMLFANLEHVQKVAIENPRGIMSTKYRQPDQIIQPWQFGDSYTKSTCLWLKCLPRLIPTKYVDRGEFFVTSTGRKLPKWYSHAPSASQANRARCRSKTFPGIAAAMADQWPNSRVYQQQPLLEW